MPKPPKVLAMFKAIPRGDGSYILLPEKPVVDSTISPAKAAEILGIDIQGVGRLIECGLLNASRPTPRKVLVSLESVLKHQEASKNPDFWKSHKWLKNL